MAERIRRCEVRFTEKEYDCLVKKAEKAGQSVSAFIRESVNKCEVRSAPPPVYSQFIRELRRIGSNIDQILRIAYTKAPMQIPELKKALSSLLEIEDKIETLYFGDDI